MREIKFKIYDKELKETHIEELQDLCEDDYWYDGETDIWSMLYDGTHKQERFVISLYTGLKDKNGVEIYEGDIITGIDYPFIDEGKQNYIGIVEYYEDVAQFGYTLQCINKNKRGISNGITNSFATNEDLICDDLEIIGNIYENSDLLEGK